VLAVLTEVDDWIRSQQLSVRRSNDTETDRSELFRLIQSLQAENAELKRQLQMTCSKTVG
jgi:hypothetical protein